MNRIHSHLNDVDLIGKLADLKEQHYHNTLILSVMVDLLVAKGILTRDEIEATASKLDHLT